LAIVLGAGLGAGLFSQVGLVLHGWMLLAMQALMYGGLALSFRPPSAQAAIETPSLKLAGLAATGIVAGMATGLLGLGGGLVMVPLMVQLMQVPIHLAIRFSTLAVLTSASVASTTFLLDGRALLPIGMLLGGTAAVAAHWSAARLDRVSDGQLTWLLRALTFLLALDSGRRALALLLSPPG
jgi:uncharacterized membrane protein YfcA